MLIQEFIFRNVTQHFLQINGLSLQEGLILNFLISAYEDNQTYYQQIWDADKLYLWITPKCILNKLPILQNEDAIKKTLKRLNFLQLIEIKKFGKLNYMYISIDTMRNAASDDVFEYYKDDKKRALKIIDKIKYIFDRGLY